MGKTLVSKQRGNTNLGCLVLILLVAILGYLCYRIIPVYMERDGFHDALLTIARWENRRIISQVMQLGENRNFTVEQKDIQVQHIRGPGFPRVLSLNLGTDYSFQNEGPISEIGE